MSSDQTARQRWRAKKHAEKYGPNAGDQRGKTGMEKRSGSLHTRWNTAKILSSHGYVKVRVGRAHPLADPNGYAYEHLIVWVSAGNPRPAGDGVIHHADGDKTNNRLENLTLTSHVEHAREHQPMESDDTVRAIRDRFASGARIGLLAKEFRLSPSRVSRFVYGETRRSAGGPISVKPNKPGRQHLETPNV
mgnify:CR=1 FL=1